MAKKLIVGNWKLYIETPDEAKQFASSLKRRSKNFKNVDIVLAPTSPLIPIVSAALKGSRIKVGAQSVSPQESGPYTGYVSAKTLKSVGATYVLVGHSERRIGENDAMVNAQLIAAVTAGLTAVLCVGERERDQGGSHFSFVTEQIASAFKNFPKQHANKLVVAYEPVWAIGKSGEYAMKPTEVQEMVIFIRKTLAESLDRAVALKVPIIYGAAVEPQNTQALLKEGKISGLLVGHASATIDEFVDILKAVR